MVFKNICVIVLWLKVASALEGPNNNDGIFIYYLFISPKKNEK